MHQVAARWVEMQRARSPVGAFLCTVVGLAVGLVLLVVLLALLVLALPVALIGAVVWWARTRLGAMKGDGRRNVRVVGEVRAAE